MSYYNWNLKMLRNLHPHQKKKKKKISYVKGRFSVSLFNGISTFMGYLMLSQSL